MDKETNSNLMKAILAGVAKQGIVLFPDQIATIAKRIGGAVEGQRPDTVDKGKLGI
jgi:hypothetical protein